MISLVENKLYDYSNELNTSIEELISIHEVRDIMANSLVAYFKDIENRKIIDKCINAGIRFKKVRVITSNPIYGKTFVFTGNLLDISRIEASKIVEKYGAKVTSTISVNTDFLIVGEKPGSKLTKAKEFKIKILNIEKFRELINSI